MGPDARVRNVPPCPTTERGPVLLQPRGQAPPGPDSLRGTASPFCPETHVSVRVLRRESRLWRPLWGPAARSFAAVLGLSLLLPATCAGVGSPSPSLSCLCRRLTGQLCWRSRTAGETRAMSPDPESPEDGGRLWAQQGDPQSGHSLHLWCPSSQPALSLLLPVCRL